MPFRDDRLAYHRGLGRIRIHAYSRLKYNLHRSLEPHLLRAIFLTRSLCLCHRAGPIYPARSKAMSAPGSCFAQECKTYVLCCGWRSCPGDRRHRRACPSPPRRPAPSPEIIGSFPVLVCPRADRLLFSAPRRDIVQCPRRRPLH